MDMKEFDKMVDELAELSNKQLAGRMMARGANGDVPLEVRALVIEAAFRLAPLKGRAFRSR